MKVETDQHKAHINILKSFILYERHADGTGVASYVY